MSDAITYTLRIQFDAEQAQQLNEEGYQVCIAKRVNDICNVVWTSQPVSNGLFFDWTEEYQVVCAQAYFEPGQVIQAGNAPVDIALGQSSTMDSQGAVTIIDNFQPKNRFVVIHTNVMASVAVKQKIGGSFQPIFLVPGVNVEDPAILEPSTTIHLFLSNTLKSGMTYDEAGVTASQIDFNIGDNQISQNVAYVTNEDARLGTFVPMQIPSGSWQ